MSCKIAHVSVNFAAHFLQIRVHAALFLQVISCEQGRVDLDEIFGKEARGIVAHLNTEGHHRGAVAAAKALAAEEVGINHLQNFQSAIPWLATLL